LPEKLMPDPPLNWIWTGLASIAGAITALSFRPFTTMSWWEIALALFVGASFAFFVGPLVVRMMFGSSEPDMRIVGAILYLLATGSNALIPMAIRWLGRMFGEGKEKPL
jgi:ABC-type uncharacterized transport system permease subunit